MPIPKSVDEYNWEDRGCEIHRSCFTCPLPRCIYDDYANVKEWRIATKKREVERLVLEEGMTQQAVADLFGLSRRQIYRLLNEVKVEHR